MSPCKSCTARHGALILLHFCYVETHDGSRMNCTLNALHMTPFSSNISGPFDSSTETQIDFYENRRLTNAGNHLMAVR